MRTLVLALLGAMLSACAAVPGTGGRAALTLLPAPARVQPLEREERDVSAHYVAEIGKNADGQLQLDVRPVQEPSIFAHPSPLRSAVIEYPDRSTQPVDARGEFDAGASTYAQKHGESIGAKPITIHVLTPIDIALQPGSFQIYVPPEEEERKEESYFRTVSARTQFINASPACKASWPHQDLAPDDTADFVFTLPISKAARAYQAALFSCDKRFADGKILGYEWVALPETKEIRFTYRYQAPSAAALAAAGVTAAREYMDLHGYTLPQKISQRFDTSCGSAGC